MGMGVEATEAYGILKTPDVLDEGIKQIVNVYLPQRGDMLVANNGSAEVNQLETVAGAAGEVSPG
jgi:hypothetical protein